MRGFIVGGSRVCDLIDEGNCGSRHGIVNREVMIGVQSDVSNCPRLDLAVHNR